MKKFIAILAIALSATCAFAQDADWIGLSYLVVGDNWYSASGPSFDSFNGADLGTFDYSLTLAGQIQSHGDNDGMLYPAYMCYSIDNGTAVENYLDWYDYDDNNNYFQSGGTSPSPINIDISAIEKGEHIIAVWFYKPSGVAEGGTLWDSNGGNNYVATFTKAEAPAPVPEPATLTLLGLGTLALALRRKLRK